VTHAYNPSYTGGKDQGDLGSKPAWQPGQLVCETLSRKNTPQKRAGGVAEDVGPEFKPQYWKKKKNSYAKLATLDQAPIKIFTAFLKRLM
jgi:hypothetical protein